MNTIDEATRQNVDHIMKSAVNVRDAVDWCRCPQRRVGLRRRRVIDHDQRCLARQEAGVAAQAVLAEVEVYFADPSTYGSAALLAQSVAVMAEAVRRITVARR